jgi:hypothetical protein
MMCGLFRNSRGQGVACDSPCDAVRGAEASAARAASSLPFAGASVDKSRLRRDARTAHGTRCGFSRVIRPAYRSGLPWNARGVRGDLHDVVPARTASVTSAPQQVRGSAPSAVGAERRLDRAKVAGPIIAPCAPWARLADLVRREGGLNLPSPVEAPETVRRSAEHQPQLASLGWALRRTALLLAIIAAMVVLGMWLFYTNIDADEASAAGTPPVSESAAPRRGGAPPL